MKPKTSPGLSRIGTVAQLLGLTTAIGVLLGLLTPQTLATPTHLYGPGDEMLAAAIAEVEKLMTIERGWAGRPNDDQFVPMVGIAMGFAPYTTENVATDLVGVQSRLLELRADPPEGENADFVMGGLSSRLLWGARLGHTARSLSVLQLEFLHTQRELENEYRQKLNDHPDRPVPEAFKESLREGLAGEEEQALSEFLTTRAEVIDDLRKAKVDMANRIRAGVVRDDDPNLDMAHAIFAVVTLDTDLNESFDVMRRSLCELKYFEPGQAYFAGMEGNAELRQLDDNNPRATLIVMVPDIREMEPVDLSTPAPTLRTYSVVSDKPSYDHGEVVTINVQASPGFVNTTDAEHWLEVHFSSAFDNSALGEHPDAPPVINDRAGDDEGELSEDWDDWGEDEAEDDPALEGAAHEAPSFDDEILELPATFPLEGANPQIIVRGLPTGEFTALVFERIEAEVTVLARTEFTLVAAAPAYPQYTLYYPPTVPEVVTWGTGNPSRETNDWSWLIPQAVCDKHNLNGLWMVLAVYGQHLFDLEGQTPELTWAGADQHLDYKLLHAGTYSIEKANGFDDPEWSNFWSGLTGLNDRREMVGRIPLDIDRADVYIVAVRLAAHTWAGPYRFKLGDLAVDWTLSHATNVAKTRFVRWMTEGGEIIDPEDEEWYQPIHAIFKNDRFFVEIETRNNVISEDKIEFELFVSRNGGPPTVVGFGKDQSDSTLHAYRVHNDRRLYRSSPLFVQQPGGANGWRDRAGRREAGIALGDGDRLVARVVPHGAARQGALGMVSVHSSPARVGASWREAVSQAADLLEVTPPRALEQLSPEEFKALLREPWDTVDSSPFVKLGGREIPLALGDLAAMLLIRQNFNETMERILPSIDRLYYEVNNVVDGQAKIREALRLDALREGSPIGDIAIEDPRFPVGTVPFRLVYDDAWLDRTFRSDLEHRRAERRRWVDDATKAAVKEYHQAAVGAYRYAKGREIKNYVPDTSLDLKNAKDMLKLTAIGMGRTVDQIMPNLLRLAEDPNAARWERFHWEIDTVARGYVGTIAALGKEFHTNEALIDKYNSMTMLVAAGTGFLLPEAAVARAIWAVINAVPMAMTVTGELPEYLSRREDVQFAIGAYQAIGQERYITAELRRRSGWALAMDMVGGSFDVVASVTQLRHARAAWLGMRSDVEIARVFANEPTAFMALPRETQASALIRLAQLSEMQASGKALTGLEATILESGTKTIDDLAISDLRPDRYLQPNASMTVAPPGEAKTVAPIIMDDGRIAYVSRALPTDADDVLIGAATIIDGPPIIWVKGEEVQLRLFPNQPWHLFDVQGFIAKGQAAQVFEIPLDSRLKALYQRLDIDASGGRCALKMYKEGPEGLAEVQGALRAEDMLRAKRIPQLRIIETGVHEGKPYLVQEFMPSPGIYKPVPGVRMDQDMQVALLELHVLLAEKNIGATDGWWANLYFKRVEGEPTICGILDQDRVWEFGDGMRSGVFSDGAREATQQVFEVPYVDLFRVKSLWMCSYTDDALALIRRGYCPWPSNKFLMMKMLEHRGWIKYDRGAGKFVSDRLDIDLVKEQFPRLNHPETVGDILFDVPEHLRHLVPDLPAGSGGGDPVPEPQANPEPVVVLPFVELPGWVRIAA